MRFLYGLLFIASVAFAFVDKANFKYINVDGRSPHISVRNVNDIDDSSVFVLKHSLSEFSQKKSVTVRDISSAILTEMGGPMLLSTADFSAESTLLEEQPVLANLLFIVDGVSSSQVRSLPLSTSAVSKHALSRSFFPSDSVATAASIATGMMPCCHKIVARQWQEHRGIVDSFHEGALSKVVNMADVMSQAWQGQSLTMSVSGDMQLTSAFAVHPTLQMSQPTWNNHALMFNDDHSGFHSLFAADIAETNVDFGREFKFNTQHATSFIDALNQLGGDLQFTFDVESSTVNVALNGGNQIAFPVSKQSDASTLFFVETASMLNTVQVATRHYENEMNDQVPDMLTFTISTVEGVLNTFGRDSEQAVAALKIVDRLIAVVSERLSQAYHDDISIQVVVLDQSPSAKSAQSIDRELVARAVASGVTLRRTFDMFYPMIYLKDNALTTPVCEKLKMALDTHYEVDVYCAHEQEITYADRALLSRDTPSNSTTPSVVPSNSTNAVNAADAAMFHIVLWMSIILVLFLYMTIYAIVNMDIGADSIIYRLTNIPKNQFAR